MGDRALVVLTWPCYLNSTIMLLFALFAKAKKRAIKLPKKWNSLEELEALTGIKLPSLEEIKVKVKGASKYIPEPNTEKSEVEGASPSPRILKVQDKLRIALYSNYLPEPVVREGPAGKKGGSSATGKMKGAFKGKPGGISIIPGINNNRSLIQQIGNIRTLKQAYWKIKRNPGNITPGRDGVTLDGIREKWFEETRKAILAGKYKFSPARRVDIPKAGGKTRPLDIRNPREKIVHTAIAMVLRSHFEPKFRESRHGFRPNKGCHTALQQIRI